MTAQNMAETGGREAASGPFPPKMEQTDRRAEEGRSRRAECLSTCLLARNGLEQIGAGEKKK